MGEDQLRNYSVDKMWSWINTGVHLLKFGDSNGEESDHYGGTNIQWLGNTGEIRLEPIVG
jgi:hypothetical protein